MHAFNDVVVWQAELEKVDYLSELKALCFNRSFVLLVFSYGINVGFE